MEERCVTLPGMTQSTPGGPATGLPDFRPSGNQGVDPALYEIENAAMDREGALWAALQEAAPWAGRTLLDLGAGTGFWLPRYADAAETIAVGPPPGYAVLGWALVFVTALPLVLIPLLEPELRSPGSLAIAAVSLGLLVWLSQVAFLRARIELAADPAAGVLRLRAPLYSRELSLDSLATVEVQDDVGPGGAYINWPVTGRARSRRGVRLDLGGPAGLVLTTHDGQRFTVVTPDTSTAAELQTTVVQATSGGGVRNRLQK